MSAQALWSAISTARRYSIAGRRHIEIDGKIVPLDSLTAAQIARAIAVAEANAAQRRQIAELYVKAKDEAHAC
jgi:hypothetical protein